ncbi:unnamed protein product [Lactuca saligna]|uniref:ubiquitinyl hydrolase 1 n=1 Tax=Lactuca saligna TaxID=75948 RepID=A0AA35VSP0_LACSI|nr:unnamed protein product [Lactuca saligna]
MVGEERRLPDTDHSHQLSSLKRFLGFVNRDDWQTLAPQALELLNHTPLLKTEDRSHSSGVCSPALPAADPLNSASFSSGFQILMGKKVNKKAARSAQKDKRIPSFSPKTVSQDIIPSIDTVINGASVIKETKTCPHLEKGINFENFSLKIASLESHKCDDCRESVNDRRTKKGKKNKGNGSKSDSNSNSIWVCLECGHFSCGGVGFPTTPQTHAARHSKQNHHPLVIKFANPNLRWCFICNTLIPVQNGEQKDTLSEFVKALKTQSLETRKDVDDSDTAELNSVNTLENGGYIVRGLVNLGNTCFFNSVLQNLLAMDKLREYLLRLEGTLGPLMVSLKKLFIETSQSTGGKNVINPRAFFGCVCVKAPQFRVFQQHDSHELLRCLLDGMCNEESGIRKRSQNGNATQENVPTFVDTIFGGQISSTVSCLECGHNSVVYEPYLDLSLPLPTKRSPPSKRVQLVSKSKKTKLPPKRTGKFRSKNKKEKDSKVDQSFMKVSIIEENSGPIKSIEPCVTGKVESVVLEETTSWLDYLEPTSESCIEDMSGIHDSGNSNEVSWRDESHVKVQESEVTSAMESRNEDPSGIQDSGNNNGVSWKDEGYLKVQESEVVSTTESRNEDLSGIQDSGDNNGVSGKDEPQVKVQESKTTESYIPDTSGIQDSRNSNNASWKDEPQLKVEGSEVTSTTESQNPDPSGIQDSGNSSVVSWKDETQIKIQDSEVTSTTESHNKDPSVIQNSGNNTEVSTSGGNEITKEPLEVDGFGIGGLFDEPELDIKPLSNGDEKKGLMTTSNSESDPDDIDDNNSPVSVEKCLAYFTTPELLTKTEHAWQCEQCSKQQRTRLKNKNKGKNGISCDSGVDHSLPNGFGSQDTESCSVNKSNGECKKHESDSSEDDDVDSKSPKVARDASKRILISRAPPVLTVHLKRFCQDARGRLSKLNGHVSFRDTIDLKPDMDPSCCKEKETYKYKLMGVVEHLGSMRGGHYVAYVKGGDCIWYHASDAYIRVTSLEEVLRCEAYILFYEAIFL